ncbi:MAG: helix-turn-helix transcriptional regulator [Clostridia bacterium]|nr:helix-turn-helix transcriptional regulator [Clostridia bacterium]
MLYTTIKIMINVEVGKRLKECRKSNKLTQREISQQLGIVIQQYQTYESGRYQLDYEKLVKVCKILNVSADYLLGISEV